MLLKVTKVEGSERCYKNLFELFEVAFDFVQVLGGCRFSMKLSWRVVAVSFHLINDFKHIVNSLVDVCFFGDIFEVAKIGFPFVVSGSRLECLGLSFHLIFLFFFDHLVGAFLHDNMSVVLVSFGVIYVAH